jgi:hypothetical protein
LDPRPEQPPAGEEAEPLDFDPTELLIPLVRRETFQFDLRASQTLTVIVADEVECAFARQGALLFLVHSRANWSVTASVRMEVENVSPAPDDPGVSFVQRAKVASSSLVTIGTPVPTFERVILPFGVFGPQLRVNLLLLQGATVATVAQSVVVSAFLVLRAG